MIEDKINDYGAASLFKVTDTEIVGPNESLMVFRGLQNHTAASMKSLEGFNRGWFEEAQTLSQRSVDTATPTFRSPGTEMYFSWNPRFAKDPVDKLFHQNASDPDFVCVDVNYWDNPWFPDDLRKDMERDKLRDPDKYAHVWCGQYERKSEARVFRNWKIEAFETPFDVQRFYYGADWGFSIDPTVLVRCWLKDQTLYIDYEAYKVGCEIDHIPDLFAQIPGALLWPITADSARPETISYLAKRQFNIAAAIKGPRSVEEGVEFLKTFDIVVHPRCVHTIDELSFYSYEIDDQTNEVLPVLEDKKNHVIDSLRYATESVRRARDVRVW